MIADGDLVYPQFSLSALHHDLRLEAESVGADRDAFEKIGAEYLARLHIREIKVTEHVRGQRETLVNHRVPEGKHACLLAGHVAGAKDSVGAAIQQQAHQLWVIGGSYSRSASWMSEKSPEACSVALRTAAPLPRFRSGR